MRLKVESYLDGRSVVVRANVAANNRLRNWMIFNATLWRFSTRGSGREHRMTRTSNLR
jgi:hypothetical protein